jgi:hypothetical protein
MTEIGRAGNCKLGNRSVSRMGFGAMQLAGPHVFGPPSDRAHALSVLRAVVASGIAHTSTPATSTDRTLQTSSSAKHSTPIVTNSCGT